MPPTDTLTTTSRHWAKILWTTFFIGSVDHRWLTLALSQAATRTASPSGCLFLLIPLLPVLQSTVSLLSYQSHRQPFRFWGTQSRSTQASSFKNLTPCYLRTTPRRLTTVHGSWFWKLSTGSPVVACWRVLLLILNYPCTIRRTKHSMEHKQRSEWL